MAPDPPVDVAVVGAGIAGLTAAALLVYGALRAELASEAIHALALQTSVPN